MGRILHCAAPSPVPNIRQPLLDLLEREMRNGAGFVRIHAAEMLCEHGLGFKAAAAMKPDLDSTEPAYRIGVWRVMARVAGDETERGRFHERIRRVLLDTAAPDRIHAAETLAKLGVGDRADRAPLETWIATLDDGAATFPLWNLLQSSSPTERAADEARLARLLESNDELARHRAAYAFSRLRELQATTVERIQRQAAREPSISTARVYLASAAYLHTPRGETAAETWRSELHAWLEKGKVNEQFEAAYALGERVSEADRPYLTANLFHPAADARIGAAGALLHLPPSP